MLSKDFTPAVHKGKAWPKGWRKNKFTFWRERRAGRCEAPRRRRCRCTSSRSANAADAPLQNVSFNDNCTDRGPPIWYSVLKPPPALKEERNIFVGTPNVLGVR